MNVNVDISTARLVVSSLGVISCLCITGIIVIASLGHEPPTVLGTILGLCVGVLVGIPITSKTDNAATPSPDPRGQAKPDKQ